jgi:hypothetical protein
MAVGSGLVIAAADVAEALTPFSAYTPILYQAMGSTPAAITRTVTRAVWLKRNGLVIYQFDITAGATSTGGCGVQLPVPAIARQVICGSLIVMGGTPPATQCFGAFMHAGLATVGPATTTGGFLDITSGQTIRGSVMYQA